MIKKEKPRAAESEKSLMRKSLMPQGQLQHKTSFKPDSVSMSGLAETTIQQLLQPAVSARRQSAFFGISHNDSVPARSRSSSSTISAASPTCRRQGRDA